MLLEPRYSIISVVLPDSLRLATNENKLRPLSSIYACWLFLFASSENSISFLHQSLVTVSFDITSYIKEVCDAYELISSQKTKIPYFLFITIVLFLLTDV